MPVEEIVVGREPEDLAKYGKRGCIFLGKHIVGTGFESHMTNPVLMDVSRPHCVLVVGKRGSGKSYSAAVIAEDIMNLPDDVRNVLCVVMIDTAGIFWSMKNPNDPGLLMLAEWELKPKSFPIRNIVPIGLTGTYDKMGIAYDGTFAIKPSALTAGDWCLTFSINLFEPLGILVERTVHKLAGKDYSLADIVSTIESDERAEPKERMALVNRFLAAEGWGIFSEAATPIEQFLQPGIATVLDVSLQEWNVRNLMLGILAREIFEARVGARREEETALIAGEVEKKIPLTWLVVDECLPHNSIVITDKAHTPIGDIVERFKKGEKFNVLGYDLKTHSYGHYAVQNVFERGLRDMISLVTETGRRLRCTPNHKILTSDGFVPAIMADNVATPTLPHYNTDRKIIIARLFGHICGDGWVCASTKSVGFSGKGCIQDLEKIKADMTTLGFRTSAIHSRQTRSSFTDISGRSKEISGTSQSLSASTKSYQFFRDLGAPVGEKAVTPFLLPDWLMNATDAEKAEFLAALVGSDGIVPSVMRKSPQSFGAVRLSFNKIEELEDIAMAYAKQLQKLFQDIGISTKITKREGNIRKDGRRTIKFVLTLSNSLQNLVHYLEHIAYRYCEKKELEGNKILAYLKAKQYMIKQRERLRKAALRLHAQGLGKCRIACRLKIPEAQVREWIYYGRRATSAHTFPTFKKWIDERFHNNLVCEKIIDKQNSGREPVYDIDVSDVHNFVANGCIVHNCHNFLPARGETAASHDLLGLVTMGRQPGISTIFITQQPANLNGTAISQADLVIAHRLTAKPDLDALATIMQTYALEDIRKMITDLPKTKGTAVLLDDNSERLFNIQVRPRQSWHAGGTPIAIKEK